MPPLSALLRRLLHEFRHGGARRYKREGNEFLRRAKHLLPWLTRSRLTYLAFFSTDSATPAMHPREGTLDDLERATEALAGGVNKAADWASFVAALPYSVFQNTVAVRLPALLHLRRLKLFKPEPVWIRRTIRSPGKAKLRVLHIPNVPLKHLQRFILHAYLRKLPTNSAAFGFEEGRSRHDHASNHCDKAVLVRLDVRDFFPSIKVEKVVPIFHDCGFRSRFALVLAHLVTFRGRLPQGAPTSPKIADLVFRPLDATLRTLAKQQHWFYSRYADDLCFSSKRKRNCSRRAIEALIIGVRHALASHGFKLNQQKTRVMRRCSRQTVVGAVVNNNTPAAPRERRRLLRAMLHNVERNGLLAEGLRYREALKEKGVAVALRDGRHPGEVVRQDRQWPYEKQWPFLPPRLREGMTEHSPEQWTAVLDFWHFLCGQVGEIASLEPKRLAEYRTKLKELTLNGQGARPRIRPSLEVRAHALKTSEQALVDLWHVIGGLVAELNASVRTFAAGLISFQPLTPPNARRTAESETDFWIFLMVVFTSLLDRIRVEYKHDVFAFLATGGFVAARKLRNFFVHGHLGQEERRLEEARQAFRQLIGKPFPESSSDWQAAQVELLLAIRDDLPKLSNWRPSKR
jgi:hypothetical protein